MTSKGDSFFVAKPVDKGFFGDGFEFDKAGKDWKMVEAQEDEVVELEGVAVQSFDASALVINNVVLMGVHGGATSREAIVSLSNSFDRRDVHSYLGPAAANKHGLWSIDGTGSTSVYKLTAKGLSHAATLEGLYGEPLKAAVRAAMETTGGEEEVEDAAEEEEADGHVQCQRNELCERPDRHPGMCRLPQSTKAHAKAASAFAGSRLAARTPKHTVVADRGRERKRKQDGMELEEWITRKDAMEALEGEDKIGALVGMKMRRAYGDQISIDTTDMAALQLLSEQSKTFREEAEHEVTQPGFKSPCALLSNQPL